MNTSDSTQNNERRGAQFTWLLALGIAVSVAGCGEFEDPTLRQTFDAATAPPPPTRDSVTPSPTRNLLWGDLHVHTALSYDAFSMGVRGTPADAYTYMKGGTIEHSIGYPIRASRPLDFGAVTDHAEFLGVTRRLIENGEDEAGPLREALRSGSPLRATWNFIRVMRTRMASRETREDGFGSAELEEASLAAWRDIVEAAERHNDPGRFTAFVAYEWTSMPDARNLHRNVIYESAAAPPFPFSCRDSENPEDLWAALDRQRANGMNSLAIPHNGNVSDGLMWDSKTFEGEPLSAAYAETRSRNEPIAEIFQIKGTSETHPSLSPDDAFADFELMDTVMSTKSPPSKPKGSYARDALRTGLEFAHRDGFNPFRFGVIGSSDSHNASSSVEEDNYHGKLPLMDGTPAQRLGTASLIPYNRLPHRVYGAAGLVAVWAEANTRKSIFGAMRRKETYATSGPRLSVRFFAGWDYTEGSFEGDWLATAYRDGVPMGGSLLAREGNTPAFLVAALKDPMGANLDRIQIIKAWVDASGVSHERVFDVAASDARLEGTSGRRIAAVGNTADERDATYSNTIGASELSVLWRDPTFDPSQEALYYARVIEIPTPRHTTYAAKLLGVEPPEPTSIQERAVTSAIWIRPAEP
ncbi:MAG: hypothetical protein CL908_06080 [Deltaproteobacteria bacterium]|nr:hypothetical protein [Deltaproteobacteria bacterium]